MKSPFCILHIPHSAEIIPPAVQATLTLSADELSSELLKMTDRYTDELFHVPSHLATSVIFPVSRLVVDPERFTDYDREPMAALGMGVVYTKTSDGLALRKNVTSDEQISLIREFYEPHHAKLADAVGAALSDWGSCLFIDCHSFPSIALPYEQQKQASRPDICLGTDPFHTPSWLFDQAQALFGSAGFTVAKDIPFQGALVPSAHFNKDQRVMSIMIEINRKLYMDEGTSKRLPAFDAFRTQLKALMHNLITAAQNKIEH